ncbi:armadillo-type protein [Blastocladiella britannica]|nr:armadillo-type protein [Blastocladiella britannica]
MTTQDFAAQLYQLLASIIAPESKASLAAVTQTLNTQFYSTAQCLPALAQIASEAGETGVRQLAAVEMRKWVDPYWAEIPAETQAHVRALLLTRLASEPERSVAQAIAYATAILARKELPNGQWGELVPTLISALKSPAVAHREVASLAIKALMEALMLDAIEPHAAEMLNALSAALADPESRTVQLNTMSALAEISDAVTSEDKAMVRFFQDQVPAMVGILQAAIAEGNEDHAAQGFVVLDNLLASEAPLLNPHLRPLVEFFTATFTATSLSEEIRIMAGNLLSLLPVYRRTRIVKLQLVEPILRAGLLTSSELDEEDEADDDADDTPFRIGLRVVHAIASEVPPAQYFAQLSSGIASMAADSSSIGARRGAMILLSIVYDSCTDSLRPHAAGILTNMILPLMGDADARVRRAACLAVGSFIDAFEDVAKMHTLILPALFALMQDLSQPKVLAAATSSLDALLDGMGDDILPYLAELMNGLGHLIAVDNVEIRQTVVGAIGSVANAADKQFIPYFDAVAPTVLHLMAIESEDKDEMLLRGIATDSMCAIADAVGAELFRPLLDESMRLAGNSMNFKDHPKLRECAFCFFGILSRVYKQEFVAFLPQLVPHLLETIGTAENFFDDDVDEDSQPVGMAAAPSPSKQANTAAGLAAAAAAAAAEESLMEESDDDDDEEDNNNHLKVMSAIAEEKSTALDVLADLCESTGPAFMPYLEATLAAMFSHTDHYHDAVRKSVVHGLFKVLVCMYDLSLPADWVAGLPLQAPVHDDVAGLTFKTVDAVVKMLEEEDERMVAYEICDALQAAIRHMGPVVLQGQGHLEALANLVIAIFERKQLSQQDDDDEDEDESEDMTEFDALLIGSAGDLVGAFAHALGGPLFAPLGPRFLQQLSKYFKASSAVSERSMAVGTMADVIDGAKAGVTPWHKDLAAIFARALRDGEAEVRSNACWGMGLLAEYSEVPTDVSALANQLASHASASPNESERDNATGAIARALLRGDAWATHGEAVAHVVNNMPIRTDFQENKPTLALLTRIVHVAAINATPVARMLVSSAKPQLLAVLNYYLAPANDNQTSTEIRAEVAAALGELSAL